MFENYVNDVITAFSKASFQLKKHLPDILVVSGSAAVVTGTVVACKNTIKAVDAMEKKEQQMKTIREAHENKEDALGNEYTEDDYKHDTMLVVKDTAIEVVKAYLPAVLLEGAGLAMIFGSHKIMKDRFTGLAAAYTTLEGAYKAYKERVKETVGEEEEYYIDHGVKKKIVETQEVDENGKTHKVKKEVPDWSDATHSPYDRIFDDSCPDWKSDPLLNRSFLLAQQNYFNQILRIKGYVFLSEVYDRLGFDTSQADCHIVGWTYDKYNPDGDNYIDFGLYDEKNPLVNAFMNGETSNVWLSFNVDGDILRKMA